MQALTSAKQFNDKTITPQAYQTFRYHVRSMNFINHGPNKREKLPSNIIDEQTFHLSFASPQPVQYGSILKK